MEEFIDPVHAPEPFLLEASYLLADLVSANSTPAQAVGTMIWRKSVNLSYNRLVDTASRQAGKLEDSDSQLNTPP